MVKSNRLITRYMDMGNAYIGTTGAIEHNLHHAELTSQLCYEILHNLGYPEREAELAAIAGYMHDIGNLINRSNHGLSGAIIASRILLDMGMDTEEIAVIMGAIGNHDENAHGDTVNNVAAALILADKSDVNRSRVRKSDFATFTPRDRVNYAVTESSIVVNDIDNTIVMMLKIDSTVCSVMEYFEIFLTKMLMCEHAAQHLNCEFKLVINNVRLL